MERIPDPVAEVTIAPNPARAGEATMHRVAIGIRLDLDRPAVVGRAEVPDHEGHQADARHDGEDDRHRDGAELWRCARADRGLQRLVLTRSCSLLTDLSLPHLRCDVSGTISKSSR